MSDYAVADPPTPGSSKAKRRTSEELQAAVIQALSEMRKRDPTTFPTLREVLDFIGEEQSKASRSACKGKLLSKRVVIPAKAKGVYSSYLMECPVCMVEEIEEFSGSNALWDYVFRIARSGKSRAFTIADLGNRLRSSHDLQAEFKKAARRCLADKSLPSNYGWVQAARSELVFDLNDLCCGRCRTQRGAEQPQELGEQRTEAVSGFSLEQFARDFDDAFEQIDREQGLTNFVKLHDLRHALPHYKREDFDRGLNQLRRERKFSLDSSEGNYVTLSQEERDAGIREAGSLLVYCSRHK